MSVNLTVVIDNDEAIKKFKELQKVAKSTTSNIVTDSERMDMAMRKLGTALGALGISFSLTEFARQVATVRGEFQKLEVAFTTMLGSKAEADALMQETVKLAATTPFDLTGVANGAKQLLAYGSTAQDVGNEIKMLGNIAAGMSLPLSDLVYLYGTTRTQGRLFTRDLMQFTGRGIPLMEELAKQFGVAKSEVSKLVTEGKVGFAEVEKALKSMTSEGGKFYNLMEEQSKTISGRMSNLGDSVQQMFNEIGKQTEGAIYKAIDAASLLVENYEKVGKALIGIAAAYGSYKAAVMVVHTLQKVEIALTEQMVIEKSILAASNHAVTESVLRHAAAQKLLAKSLVSVKGHLTELVSALANPYVLAGAAIAGFAYQVYKVIDLKNTELDANEKVADSLDESAAALDKEKNAAMENARIMNDANATTYERIKGYKDLVAAYPELLEKYGEEKLKLMDILEIERELSNINYDRQISDLKKRRSDILATLKADENTPKLYDAETGVQLSGLTIEEIAQYNSDVKALTSNIQQLEREQQEAAFKALPTKERLAQYKTSLEAVTKEVAMYIRFMNQALEDEDAEAAKFWDAKAKAAEQRKNEISRQIDQIEGTNNGGGDEAAKALAKKRQEAQKEAHKAEMEAKKSQIKDKVELLEYERDEELKAIRERIMAEKDLIVEQSLIDLWNATYEKFDNQIKAAINDKKVQSIVSQLTFNLPEWTKVGDLGIQDPSAVVKKNAKENIPEVMALFGDLSRVGAESLREIAKEARAAMGAIGDPQDAAVISDKIDEIEDKADSLEPPLKRLGKNIKDLFTSDIDSEAWRDAFGELGESFQDIIAYTQALDGVLDSIGHGGALDGAIDGLNAAFNAFQAAGKGAQIGNVFGPIGAAAGAAIGAVGSLVKSISQIHDKRKEQNIQRLQEQIEDLEYSYDRLGVAVSKAYSTDANKLIEEQIRLLEKQKQLVEEQIQEEDEKKNSDNKRIDDYKKKIDEINDAIEESEERAKTALMGVSFDEFRDSFLDTLSDMSSSAEDFSDNFEGYLKKAILNALIVAEYEQRIKDLRDATIKALSDGELLDEERAALKAEHDAIVNDMLKDRKELAEMYGWSDDSGGGSSSTGKGFQAMSQETGSELNGRFTDIQGKVTEIRSFVMDLMATGKMQYNETVNIRDIMIQLNGNVADIKSYAKVLPEMRDSINQMSKKLDNL